MKIERGLLIFLSNMSVPKIKICELLGVSRTTLFEYLKDCPITEDELNSINMNRDNLIGYFWQYIINNRVNQPQNTNFRLPENKVKNKNINQAEKVKPKTIETKSSKNCDEETKQIEDDDVSFLMQQSNNLAKQAEKFNK